MFFGRLRAVQGCTAIFKGAGDRSVSDRDQMTKESGFSGSSLFPAIPYGAGGGSPRVRRDSADFAN